jgi:hypothetical protein
MASLYRVINDYSLKELDELNLDVLQARCHQALKKALEMNINPPRPEALEVHEIAQRCDWINYMVARRNRLRCSFIGK